MSVEFSNTSGAMEVDLDKPDSVDVWIADRLGDQAMIALDRAEVERLHAQLGAWLGFGLSAEWGWDVAGRKQPNPTVIRGDDGRPAVERPQVVADVVLYSRQVSDWSRA